MYWGLLSILIALGLLLLMYALMRMGERQALQLSADADAEARRGTGPVEASMFALLGLLLAFAFAGAGSRFEGRRDQIVHEANAVGTSYLRLDLLPADRQPALRQLFRDYLDERLTAFALSPSPECEPHFDRANAMQKDIWRAATEACAAGGDPSTRMLVLPPINEMFDIASTRAASRISHPPMMIFLLVVAVSSVCATMAGRDMASRISSKRLYRFGFVVIVALTFLVIIDLEFPRIGFMQLDRYDVSLKQVRQAMD